MVSADGAPHVVPVCFVLVDELAFTAVDHKPKRRRQLRRTANLTGEQSSPRPARCLRWTSFAGAGGPQRRCRSRRFVVQAARHSEEPE